MICVDLSFGSGTLWECVGADEGKEGVIEEELNRMGQLGWELIHVNYGSVSIDFFFKRPK